MCVLLISAPSPLPRPAVLKTARFWALYKGSPVRLALGPNETLIVTEREGDNVVYTAFTHDYYADRLCRYSTADARLVFAKLPYGLDRGEIICAGEHAHYEPAWERAPRAVEITRGRSFSRLL